MPPGAEPSQCVSFAAADGGLAAGSIYLQLLGLGLLLIYGHCAGMCGPLIMAFRFGVHRELGAGRMRAAAGQLVAYQFGRALVYASAGALAGLGAGALGAGLQQGLRAGAPLVILCVAVAFAILAVRAATGGTTSSEPGLAVRLGVALRKRWDGRPLRQALGLGTLMAFLPCMIPLWALGLAAASGSPLHGAGVMVLLVVLTTPALLPFAIGGGWLARLRARFGKRVQVGALAFSSVWLGLISLSALELVPHARVALGDLQVVFW